MLLNGAAAHSQQVGKIYDPSEAANRSAGYVS
jgi:hypothetical protein